jgi:hypothetical protein
VDAEKNRSKQVVGNRKQSARKGLFAQFQSPKLSDMDSIGMHQNPWNRQAQMENEEPQPQVVEAFGLRTTNWEPVRSSL